VTAIDDHGVRFLLALRIWAYLRKSASHAGRQHQLSHRDWSWALHSQAQEILLDAVLMLGGGNEAAIWPALRGILSTEVSGLTLAAGALLTPSQWLRCACATAPRDARCRCRLVAEQPRQPAACDRVGGTEPICGEAGPRPRGLLALLPRLGQAQGTAMHHARCANGELDGRSCCACWRHGSLCL